MRAATLVIILLLVSLQPAAAAQIGRECYGDSIDVDLTTGPGGPATHLRVPLSLHPSIATRDGSINPPDPMHQCMPEPVTAESIFLIFNHRAEPELGFTEGLSLISLELRYGAAGWNPQLVPSMDAHVQHYLDAGVSVVMPNGFTKLFPTPSDSGDYLSPADYLEPGGRRLEINCGGMVFITQCDTYHGTHENLWISYRFDYAKVDQMRWRELDHAAEQAGMRLLR